MLVLLNNLTNEQKKSVLLISVEILEKSELEKIMNPHIHVVTEKETETEITVYGLRGLAYSKEATEALRRKKSEDRLIFANDKFKVYDNHVEDICYGKPDAYIINSEEIVSADRILERISMEKNKMGRHDKKVMENRQVDSR